MSELFRLKQAMPSYLFTRCTNVQTIGFCDSRQTESLYGFFYLFNGHIWSLQLVFVFFGASHAIAFHHDE